MIQNIFGEDESYANGPEITENIKKGIPYDFSGKALGLIGGLFSGLFQKDFLLGPASVYLL